VDGSARTVQVTHPFHPLFGRAFPFVEYRQTWAEDRVYFSDGAGRLRQLPAAWTDAAPADPFVVVSAGRAVIRFEDLLALATLLAQLADAHRARVPTADGAEVA
jgi:hypothetical protein